MGTKNIQPLKHRGNFTNGVSVFQRTIDRIIQEEKLSDSFTICRTTKEEHAESLQAFYDDARKYNISFNHHKSITGVTKLTLLGYTLSHMYISSDCEVSDLLLKCLNRLLSKYRKELLVCFLIMANLSITFQRKFVFRIIISNFHFQNTSRRFFNL